MLDLEKFREVEVEVDFKDVVHFRQGFADEVFRVFVTQHPETKFQATNANRSVAALIRHVGGVVT